MSTTADADPVPGDAVLILLANSGAPRGEASSMLWSLSAVSAEAGGKVRKRAMTLHAPGHGIGGHIPVIPMADE